MCLPPSLRYSDRMMPEEPADDPAASPNQAATATRVISASVARGHAEERRVLQALEQVLEQPEDQREAFIADLDLPVKMQARLQQLLQQQPRDDDFLATGGSVVAPLQSQLPSSGDRVGIYRIERLLGAGGMGVVYLAQRDDGVYAQQVAIKLLPPNRLLTGEKQREQLLSRFDDERAMLAQLQHPNIVRILDGGRSEEGMPYLVMEYVDGVDLLQYCQRDELSVAARLRLFAEVCEAVQEAHRHLIVHRDLKPGNVLVDAQGVPHLLDFGIAKLVDPILAAQVDAQTTMMAMTPAYASPEQIRHQPITTRSDIYSLGVMLYEMLTGIRPYQAYEQSPVEMERAISQLHPPTLSSALHLAGAEPGYPQLPRRLPADLETIVAKALHKEPERRYGSAQELAEDLGRFLDGQPVKARPDSWLYRSGKFLRRHRIASALVALSIVLILAATGAALHQAQQAERKAQEAVEINAFLIDVLNQANVDEAGSEVSMADVLEAAAARIDTYFSDRPAIASGVRLVIGNSLQNLNRLDAAETQLRTGLAEASASLGPSQSRTIELTSSLAWLLHDQGKLSEARDLYGGLIARMQRDDQIASLTYVRLENDLAVLFLIDEDYASAREHLNVALDTIEKYGLAVSGDEHANILGNLAQALHGLGDLDTADTMYARASELLKVHYPEGSRDTAIAINNRASLAWDRKQPAQALELMAESVEMRRRVYASDHPVVIFGLINLAQMALASDELDKARLAIDEAIAMLDRLPEGGNEERVMAEAARVQIMVAQGQVLEARQALQKLEKRLLDHAELTTRALTAVEQARTSVADGTIRKR